jgi:hypothetical protein
MNKKQKEQEAIKKEKEEALNERMKRTTKVEVKIPMKGNDLRLGNLRKLLAEQSDKFDDEATVYISDDYRNRDDDLRRGPGYLSYTIVGGYGYSEPRYTLTITSVKEIS